MRSREFTCLMQMLDVLTPRQRNRMLGRLNAERATDEVAVIIQSGLGKSVICPRCKSTRTVRNGVASGLQRYKCRSCARTFNALTGTPLARLRHRDKWLAQAHVLDEGLSVRKAAARMQVHRTTAFRWRHRFLAVPCEVKALGLDGVVEVDETYVLRSFKGQRRRLALIGAPARKPRHRGGRARKRGLSAEQVAILIARNRSGRSTDSVLPIDNAACISEVLLQAVAADCVLCTDGAKQFEAAARTLGLQHQAVNIVRGERIRGAWHIQNVNAYHGRFKQWMQRFKGVATSYLPNYLGWFRALDRNAQSGAAPSSLLALAIRA